MTNYTFNKDYPLGNKKKGDVIILDKVPTHLKEYFKETATGAKTKAKPHKGEIPTDKNTKDDIIKFLHANGVTDTKGLDKEDLLMLVDPFYSNED